LGFGGRWYGLGVWVRESRIILAPPMEKIPESRFKIQYSRFEIQDLRSQKLEI
jgi:hypothetical protein